MIRDKLSLQPVIFIASISKLKLYEPIFDYFGVTSAEK